MNTPLTRAILLISALLCEFTAISQQKPISLIESSFTVKNSSREEYYFGLAEGDQITFSVNVSDATIKGVEFCEYPNTTIFGQSNVGSIENKTITITHTGIYYFQFRQSGFLAGKRSCSLKATRTPASAKTAGFNVTVYWEEKTDTIWYNESEKYIVSIDTIVTPVAEQIIKLKKKGKADRSMVLFTLPEKFSNWAIWIGTGKDAAANFTRTEKQMAATFPYINKYGLMTALALSGSASFVTAQECLPVSYWFLPNQAEQQKFNSDSVIFLANKKNTCLDFAKRSDTIAGTNYIGVYNENKKNLDVVVKIASVLLVENWGTRSVRKFRVETKHEPYLKN